MFSGGPLQISGCIFENCHNRIINTEKVKDGSSSSITDSVFTNCDGDSPVIANGYCTVNRCSFRGCGWYDIVKNEGSALFRYQTKINECVFV